MVKIYSPIKSRVVQFIERQKIKKEEFYLKTSIGSGNFKGKNAESELGGENIVKILTNYSDLNPEWLLTGKGNMINKPVPGTTANHSAEGIPLIPIEAMAGAASGDMQVMEYESERFVVPTFKGADYLISVRGSSMYPKYNSGDIVACKRLELGTFFQWNKVYVLDTVQGPLIKRVCPHDDPEHVQMVSDNKDYAPFKIHLSDIRALAIVMGVIRLE